MAGWCRPCRRRHCRCRRWWSRQPHRRPLLAACWSPMSAAFRRSCWPPIAMRLRSSPNRSRGVICRFRCWRPSARSNPGMRAVAAWTPMALLCRPFSDRCSTAPGSPPSRTPIRVCWTATRCGIGRWDRCSSFRRRGGGGPPTGTTTASAIRRTCTTPAWPPRDTCAPGGATCPRPPVRSRRS